MALTGLGHASADRIVEKLKAVTPQQVQAVARKYFGDDALTIATLIPLPLKDRKPAPTLPPPLRAPALLLCAPDRVVHPTCTPGRAPPSGVRAPTSPGGPG